MKITKKARIERNPIIYRYDRPPELLPPRWNIWSDEKMNGAGNLVGVAFTLGGAKWLAASLGYDGRVWLRSGDKGKEQWKPTVRWVFHRLQKRIRSLNGLRRLAGLRVQNSAQARSSGK